MVHSVLRNHAIVFSKSAEKFLDGLDRQDRQRILKKVRELQTSSENLDIKKLQSRHELYRLRVGSFRVIYTLKHERVVIYVVADRS